MEVRTVRDLVLTKFESADENDAILAAEALMTARGLGAIPVRGGDGRIGAVVTRRELTHLRDAGIDIATLSAGEVARSIVPLDAGESLEAALASLRKQEVGRLPIVENGRELGIVTQADIRGYLGARQELGPKLNDLVKEVSPEDEMLGESFWSYVGIGVSALGCIRRAQEAAAKESFESILDFACGHGRVLRVLKAAFSDARLAACDINADGVRFCARVLGATPFVSREDPEEIELAGEFDLIWCGSLLTHVGADRWRPFLRLFESVLAPAGLLVFTTLGPAAAERLRAGALYGSPPEPERVEAILNGYEKTGFGYSDYDGQPGYGLSLCSPEWLRRLIEGEQQLRLLHFEEAAWAPVQDVVACVASG